MHHFLWKYEKVCNNDCNKIHQTILILNNNVVVENIILNPENKP